MVESLIAPKQASMDRLACSSGVPAMDPERSRRMTTRRAASDLRRNWMTE